MLPILAMTIFLRKVHPNTKKSSAYVPVIESTGPEGHPLSPIVGAAGGAGAQCGALLPGGRGPRPRVETKIDTRPKPQQF